MKSCQYISLCNLFFVCLFLFNKHCDHSGAGQVELPQPYKRAACLAFPYMNVLLVLRDLKFRLIETLAFPYAIIMLTLYVSTNSLTVTFL